MIVRGRAQTCSKEGTMTYGFQELYNQPGISVISGVAHGTPDRKRREDAERKKKAAKNIFAGKLEEEQIKLSDREINYYASGYTRAAKPYRTEVKMKQYG